MLLSLYIARAAHTINVITATYVARTMWIPMILSEKELHIICNASICGLPDMFNPSPQAYGTWASGVHIRQTTGTHVTNEIH